MTHEILTNQTQPISEVGNWFVITAKNNINGTIIFSDNSGNTKLYVLKKYQRNEFNIDDMRKENHIIFDPEFVEIRTNDDQETIMIDIAPVNP
jgi:hypothetical protein